MFGEIFPASFWPLACAHSLALLCPGPDFFLIVSHGARHRLRGSAFICIGIALGNAAYVTLAIVGWVSVGGGLAFRRPIEIAGATYLAWLGMRLLRSGPPPVVEAAGEVTRFSYSEQFIMGLASAILNPKNMIFYLTVMTVLIEKDALIIQRIAAGVWMCVAVLGWDLFVAAAVAHPSAQRILWSRLPFVEKICGVFLIGVAASLVASPWF